MPHRLVLQLATATLLPTLIACGAPPPAWEARQLGPGVVRVGDQVLDLTVSTGDPTLLWTVTATPRADAAWQDTLSRSDDAGRTWTPVPARDLGDVLALVATPACVIEADAEGIAVSRDGGQRFRRVDCELAGELPALLSVAPHAPDQVLCATQTGQVRRSRDAGETWSRLPDCPGSPVALLPLADRLLLLNERGVFAWEEGRAGWSLQFATGTAGAGALVAAPDGQLVLATVRAPNEPARLARSLDGGRSWSALDGPPSVADVALDPVQPTTVYALCHGEQSRVLVSRDRGETWTPLSGDLGHDAGWGILWSPWDLWALPAPGGGTTLLATSRLDRRALALSRVP